MALVIETGAGLPNANSFATVAEADQYYADIGNADWAALTTTDKESALIKAAAYVSNGQIFRFDGVIAVYGQALAWPRSMAVYWGGAPAIPSNVVPNEAKRGQIIAAIYAANGVLPGYTGSVSTAREIKSEAVGDLKVEYYQSASAAAQSNATDASLVLPSVYGALFPLLDQDFYEAQDATTGVKTAPVVGPSYAAPQARQFWPGMHDVNQGGMPETSQEGT